MKSKCSQAPIIVWILIKISNDYGLINSTFLFCKLNILNHRLESKCLCSFICPHLTWKMNSTQKQIVQQSLDKLELMKKALMQEYFG